MMANDGANTDLAGPYGSAKPLAPAGGAAKQVDALDDLGLHDLRERWQDIYGVAAPARLGTEFLRRAISFHLQEQLLGGLSKQARLRLKALDSRRPGEPAASKDASASQSLKAGTRFVREWQGETHEVQAVEDGRFVYRGKIFRSLSVIAREITGTHQSGPRFFGIKRNAPKREAGENGDG